MIIGVDHIALSSENVVRDAPVVESAGFSTQFCVDDLPNSTAKTSLLRQYSPLHSMAYCKSEGGIAIELVQHSHPLGSAQSPYHVLMGGRPEETVSWSDNADDPWHSGILDSIGCLSAEPVTWTPFMTRLWCGQHRDSSVSGRIHAILLRVSDISASERFWIDGMGCKCSSRGLSTAGRRWTHLAFRAFVPSWSVSLILSETGTPPGLPCLDDAGFTCLALLSNRLEDDLRVATENGGMLPGKIFYTEISGKQLRIAMLRGPDGEPVELIQPLATIEYESS